MYESYRFLESRGADVEALDATEAKTRFPQFVFDAHETCLYDPWAGYLESGQSLLFMSQMASGLGVQLALDTPVTAIDETTNGVRIQAAVPHDFDLAVVATGVWLGRLVPALTAHVQVSQQQMVFIEVDPDLDRDGTPEFAQRAAEFLRRRIPEMAAGRITGGRSCLYASTPDDHFFIDRAPGSSRVFVAGGGSGHGFKFGGAIGEIVADAVEDRDNPLGAVFRIGNRLAQAEHDRPYRGFATPRADS
jgi:glycine/D-amino acid oxidase-like deaminating enzyme